MDSKNNNSTLFISPSDAPSYKFESTRSKPGSGYLLETWRKIRTDGTPLAESIKVVVYPVKNKTAAFSLAKKLFRAITDKKQQDMFGRPKPGSYSGQPIGDYCWAYSVGLDDEPEPMTEGVLVVVQGNYLFRLQISGGDDAIAPSFIDNLGKAVATRLQNLPTPPGFEDANRGHGNDPDHHDDDNPGNGNKKK